VGDPLISVVIPCFKQAQYLGQAIESVLAQTYSSVQIVVVDDGSPDNTGEVAARYECVLYVRQQNLGLAAARNRGIESSKGELLVFLDADDVLLPDALERGFECLAAKPECGFVFGAHRTVYLTQQLPDELHLPRMRRDPYLEFLTRNCVGMNATAMFRRAALTAVNHYDTSLKAAEDYDVFLRISRHFPVSWHTGVVAEYRIHGENMSANPTLMLKSSLHALTKQKRLLSSGEQKAAWRQGIREWQEYYGCEHSRAIRRALEQNEQVKAWRGILTLTRYAPRVLLRQARKQTARKLRGLAKRLLPGGLRRVLKDKLGLSNSPRIGRVRFGHFRRLEPIDRDFGFNRGVPIDRYYIEGFLTWQSQDIKGRVLEIGDSSYTNLFGANRVSKSDVLHVDPGNPVATFVGDLTCAPQIPSNAFDCFILTQTLHLIYDFKSALGTIYRILRPGGVLLLTTPGITKIGDVTWSKTWYWSFTHLSVQRMLEELFPANQIQVHHFGNLLAATGFLQGLCAADLKTAELDEVDKEYQVIVAARAVKPMEAG
jgi:glycosyltransferase involved in cell wall biosynthesis